VKAYIITTGAVFAMITIAHLLRFMMEGSHLLTEPVYILLTLIAASLAGWAWVLFRRSSRTS
jgi:hypothetical protein